jgi:uncharacterized membrane protein YhhN
MDKTLLIIALVWVIYIAVLLPLYILKQNKIGSVQAVGYKLVLSAIFTAIGFSAGVIGEWDVFPLLFLLGFVFSFVGDYYLIYIKTDEKKFIKGIFFFALAQLFFIAAMGYLVGFQWIEFALTFMVVVVMILFKRIKKPIMGNTTKPLSGYSLLVVFMAVKSLLLCFQEMPPLNMQILFSVGSILFLISDISLGLWRFVFPKKILYYMVSICYFVGQLFMATAILLQY